MAVDMGGGASVNRGYAGGGYVNHGYVNRSYGGGYANRDGAGGYVTVAAADTMEVRHAVVLADMVADMDMVADKM